MIANQNGLDHNRTWTSMSDCRLTFDFPLILFSIFYSYVKYQASTIPNAIFFSLHIDSSLTVVMIHNSIDWSKQMLKIEMEINEFNKKKYRNFQNRIYVIAMQWNFASTVSYQFVVGVAFLFFFLFWRCVCVCWCVNISFSDQRENRYEKR